MQPMPTQHILKRLVHPRIRRAIGRYRVSREVRQLSGPKRLQLSKQEAVVTCVVKNGEFYIDGFIKHYSEMGFRHIFFLDNGSSDRTISIAQQYPNVSVCRSDLPIEAHQGAFKSYLAAASSDGGWCLDADIDEFFDYPSSDQVSLADFLEYLNQDRSTGVITQLLDMFSDKPLPQLSTTGGHDLKTVYQYYDLSDVTRTPYREASIAALYGSRNVITHDKTALYFGGMRKTLYGNNCLLTKHSLFRPEQVELFPHVHFVDRARLADVSGVMLHYKLTGNALEIAVQNKEGFKGNSKGYIDFINFLTNGADHQIRRESALNLRSADDLLQSGFLFVSERYRDYVRAKSEGTRQVQARVEVHPDVCTQEQV